MMDHNKAKKVAKILALILAAAMIITSFSFVVFLPGLVGMDGYVVYAAENGNTDAYLDDQMKVLEDLIKEIRDNYKDEVSYKTLVEGAFNGVFESLNDPFSVYYATVEEGDEFMDNASAEFSGVGVSIEKYEDQCRVVAPIQGGPAEKAGIRTGDIITKVSGTDITGKELSEVSALLKGQAGTKVTVSVSRNGVSMEFTLTREKIQSATVDGSMLDGGIGYIRITQFGVNTHNEFKAIKLKLLNEGANSLIIDARSNPGGVMAAAADIAEQLMPAGPIFHFAQQGKIVETVEGRGAISRSVPIVMLVNEGSASATEALAGALQDSGTAALVGTTTYGKGIAQQIVELPNGAAFKLSMFYFLTPDGHQIDHKGIVPDYTVYNGLGLSEAQIDKIYSDLAPMTEEKKYSAGESGLNVYAAQQRLLYLGYHVEMNGTMDEATVEAIKKFQTEQGFSAYGGLDFTTVKALGTAFDTYIKGGDQDKQLEKAVELLKK